MWTLLLGSLVGSAAAEPVRHALVVGADEGGGQLEKLQYAERDAEKMAGVLVELGSFDEELVTVLYAPTPEELREALAAHAAVAEAYEDDLFERYCYGEDEKCKTPGGWCQQPRPEGTCIENPPGFDEEDPVMALTIKRGDNY